MDRYFIRRRDRRRLFHAGAAACFLLGVVIAARFTGADVVRLLGMAIAVGLAGSFALFVVLKSQDRPRRRY